ncbi:high frequency lysogenization protein HflD [Lysobacter lycopersici]
MLALAGVAQALAQVRRLADTGQADGVHLQPLVESVFRIDAETPAAVYGGTAAVAPGLRILRAHFGNQARDPMLPRLALALLQVERHFVADDGAVRGVREGIETLAPLMQSHGALDREVLSGLARVYVEHISPLRPRIMVQGNPHYLAQADLVGEVRAALLAALRSAVLWRQLDGTLWDFLLRKQAIRSGIDALLA